MKIICIKTREINTKTSCKREFCCKKLKAAFGDICSDGGHNYYTNFVIDEGSKKVRMSTHHDWNGDSSGDNELIDYCPFCGAKLIVENIKIDNTGLPILPQVDYIITDEPKKDNLWTMLKEFFR